MSQNRRLTALLGILAGVALLSHPTCGAASTLVAAGSVWKYLDTGVNLGTAWRSNAFNDTPWASGPAPLGYGEMNVGVWPRTTNSFGPDPNNKHITIYYRHSFAVADPTAYAWLQGRLLRDDGAVVYLNGTEIFRSNMPNDAVNSLSLATNLTMPVTWMRVTNAPVYTNGLWVASLPMSTNGQCFFRVQTP